VLPFRSYTNPFFGEPVLGAGLGLGDPKNDGAKVKDGGAASKVTGLGAGEGPKTASAGIDADGAGENAAGTTPANGTGVRKVAYTSGAGAGAGAGTEAFGTEGTGGGTVMALTGLGLEVRVWSDSYVNDFRSKMMMHTMTTAPAMSFGSITSY